MEYLLPRDGAYRINNARAEKYIRNPSVVETSTFPNEDTRTLSLYVCYLAIAKANIVTYFGIINMGLYSAARAGEYALWCGIYARTTGHGMPPYIRIQGKTGRQEYKQIRIGKYYTSGTGY